MTLLQKQLFRFIKKIVYNDIDDQLWIIDLMTSNRTKLTKDNRGYFSPVWSPDSRKIAASSLSGDIWVFDHEIKKSYQIGAGGSVSWLADSKQLVYSEYHWGERLQLISAEPVIVDYDGKNKNRFEFDGDVNIVHVSFSAPNQQIVYVENSSIITAQFKTTPSQNKFLSVQKTLVNTAAFDWLKPPPIQKHQEMRGSADIKNFQAPYFHQVYDTPNWFNGHWACGATSAMMALTYYNVLPDWNCNCSSPYAHVSTHGRYICEIYSFNGYTYDIGGYDPNSSLGYGGYGFIIQNNWADTKGNMAKYARQHGLGSTVDWSPTFSKLQNDIDKEFPIVILNSLTTAGHYILAIGYNGEQRSVRVNDPYGNKNQGYMNYNGRDVVYDWPGYSSGHSNLNVVHCLIYMRDGCDLSVGDFILPDTVETQETISFDFKIYNLGSKASDSSEVTIYLSPNIYFNELDSVLGKIFVPEIGAKDSVTISVEAQIPDSLHSGYWAIAALVDEDNLLIENSRENNLSYDKFLIKGYPYIFRLNPVPNMTVTQARPEISARYKDSYFGMVDDSVYFYFDGEEVTDSCGYDGNKVYYFPENPLSAGTHRAKIKVQNNLGNWKVVSWEFEATGTDVKEKADELVTREYILKQNYPNPFNSSTQIQYNISTDQQIKIEIFSITGEKINTLVNEFKRRGNYSTVWNGKDQLSNPVSTGIYLYKISGADFSQTKRMVFIK
ncbi:hypothetical protein B6I21_02635 [candidate division KSB1 bacterium 4572_119]|nr:MAG: hypothetical protein B6I21_02635 [candidate division KSB1 bacterium 4572_119]